MAAHPTISQTDKQKSISKESESHRFIDFIDFTILSRTVVRVRSITFTSGRLDKVTSRKRHPNDFIGTIAAGASWFAIKTNCQNPGKVTHKIFRIRNDFFV